MGAAAIGIKLADSKFFPVLEEGRPASKILDLTTVRDNQTSVQINLFRNSADTIEDAEYVGTLIIEDISDKAAGEPTIELTLTLGGNNELSAEAVDLESGSRQVLTVSLETLDRGSLYGIPDFDLAPPDDSVQLGYDPDHQNVVIEGPVPGNAPEGLYEMNDDEKRGGIFLPAWLCILILAVGVLALVLALLVSARVLLLNKTESQAPAAAPVVEAPVVPAVEAPALRRTGCRSCRNAYSAARRGSCRDRARGRRAACRACSARTRSRSEKYPLQDQVGRYSVGYFRCILQERLALPDHCEAQQDQESESHYLRHLYRYSCQKVI